MRLTHLKVILSCLSHTLGVRVYGLGFRSLGVEGLEGLGFRSLGVEGLEGLGLRVSEFGG